MAVTVSETTVQELRDEFRSLSPPYLLRKYEATEDDYEALSDEDLRCEFIDGVLIVHSPATFQHEGHVSFLLTLLNVFVAGRSLGWVRGSNTVMQLGRRRFCPDISFLASAHGDRIQAGRVMGPMDLVVEVISKSTRDYDLSEKRNAYHEGRIPEIWFFDAEQRRCYLDVLEGRRYRSRSLIRGRFTSRVLPGLSIDVKWLWSDPLPDPLKCLKLFP
jgi:Uma2 family endonuclease